MRPLLLQMGLAIGSRGAEATLAGLPARACPQCFDGVVVGVDAGAYKDINHPGCEGGPCDCSKAGSPCFVPGLKAGSVEHEAACCALCSLTEGCAGWAINTGVVPDVTPDEGTCWLKHTMEPLNPGQPQRAYGYVRPGSPCASALGSGLAAFIVVGLALYVGGGTLLGAKSGRGSGLRAHPHYGHWQEVAALVFDGVAFAKGGRQRRGYAGVGGGSGSGPQGREDTRKESSSPPSSRGGGKAQRSEKGTEGRRGKEEKKAKEKDDRSGGQAEAASAPPEVAPTTTAAAAPGTASAGGGRWVHITFP